MNYHNISKVFHPSTRRYYYCRTSMTGKKNIRHYFFASSNDCNHFASNDCYYSSSNRIDVNHHFQSKRVYSQQQQQGIQSQKNQSHSYSTTNTTTPTPTPTDYFQMLGIERSFTISQSDLKTKYKSIMNQIHPDKQQQYQGLQNQQQQEQESLQPSDVTRAYDILRKDYDRSIHLLELIGHPLKENQSGDIVGNEFLLEIMETREDIDRISQQSSPSKAQQQQQQEELKYLQMKNQNHQKDIIKKLSRAFEEQNFDTAKRYTAMLQYYNKIEECLVDMIHL